MQMLFCFLFCVDCKSVSRKCNVFFLMWLFKEIRIVLTEKRLFSIKRKYVKLLLTINIDSTDLICKCYGLALKYVKHYKILLNTIGISTV